MTIRDAKSSDAEDILNLIKELALFEKEPESVKTTVDDIVRDGFGENPYFNAFVAEVDGVVKGFALYYSVAC